MSERAAEVYLDTADGPRHVGSAYFHGQGGRLRTSFSYAREWLGDAQAFALATSASLQAGSFQSGGLPGFLSDAAPDRWGRRLIFRGAQNQARQEGVAMRSLDDVDYLLGVDDWSRMGALRLSVDGGRTYLGKAGFSGVNRQRRVPMAGCWRLRIGGHSVKAVPFAHAFDCSDI